MQATYLNGGLVLAGGRGDAAKVGGKPRDLVVCHVTVVAIEHELLKSFWPMVID